MKTRKLQNSFLWIIAFLFLFLLVVACKPTEDSGEEDNTTSEGTEEGQTVGDVLTNASFEITQFKSPESLQLGERARVTATITGGKNETVFFRFEVVQGQKKIVPSSGTLLLKGEKGDLTAAVTAPDSVGTSEYRLVVTNSLNKTIQKSFQFEITE